MLRLLLPLLLLAFTVYAVVDCIQTDADRVRNLPKLAWVVIVLLFPPAGGIAWLLAGRPAAAPMPPIGPGTLGRTPQDRPRRPRGPDDDPDFLKNL